MGQHPYRGTGAILGYRGIYWWSWEHPYRQGLYCTGPYRGTGAILVVTGQHPYRGTGAILVVTGQHSYRGTGGYTGGHGTAPLQRYSGLYLSTPLDLLEHPSTTTSWEHRALYNNTNNRHRHTHMLGAILVVKGQPLHPHPLVQGAVLAVTPTDTQWFVWVCGLQHLYTCTGGCTGHHPKRGTKGCISSQWTAGPTVTQEAIQ